MSFHFVDLRDRITLSAPASEVISAINVSEGQTVATGDILLQLNTQIADAKVRQLQADVAAKSAQLAELQAGALRVILSRSNEPSARPLVSELQPERATMIRIMQALIIFIVNSLWGSIALGK